MMCGDFNDLDMSEITSIYPLNQIVTFATHENNTLDPIIGWYYQNKFGKPVVIFLQKPMLM